MGGVDRKRAQVAAGDKPTAQTPEELCGQRWTAMCQSCS